MMKWTYSVRNKTVAAAALLSLCLLVLFSNFIDRDHTNNVKTSISTLYEDRLIVEDYILKMTNDVYQIKEALSTSDTSDDAAGGKIPALISNINDLSNAYQKTKLTESEKVKFAALLEVIAEFKSTRLHTPQLEWENADKALALLNELAAIQLEESKLIMDRVEVLFISGKTSLQFASAIILVILLVLQALVFTSKTLNTSNQTSAACLN